MGISGLIDVDCSHQWVPKKTVVLIPEKNAVHNTVWMMMLAVRRCDLSFWVWGSGHRDPTQTVRERSRRNPIQIDGYQVTRACVDNQAKYSRESPPPQYSILVYVSDPDAVWCRATVEDGGPTSNRHRVNVSRSPGSNGFLSGDSLTWWNVWIGGVLCAHRSAISCWDL